MLLLLFYRVTGRERICSFVEARDVIFWYLLVDDRYFIDLIFYFYYIYMYIYELDSIHHFSLKTT